MEFVVASMDLMLNTMRQVRNTVNEAADLIIEPLKKNTTSSASLQIDANTSDAIISTDNQPYLEKGTKPMYEEHNECKDLSGDDVKYVSYSIVFRKPDFEATLQLERQEVIDYSTDGASFAAQKISQFRGRLASDPTGLEIPYEWQGEGKRPAGMGYNFQLPVVPTNPIRYRGIDPKDDKYIAFVFRVTSRFSKEKANYDKEQIDAIRESSRDISAAIDRL